MTTEKAIELLHRISDSQFDGIHGDERREALSMAVRALFSQQTVNDSQELVNDCISRQGAIEVVEEYADRLQMVDWKEKPCVPYKVHALNWCINSLRELPSAQPERKKGGWIEMGTNSDGTHNIKCSKCGEGYKTRGHAMSYNTKKRYKICPSCWADMRGESE